jgi:ubiquinone/menaquinone biosynthesis C-methylase UbiE
VSFKKQINGEAYWNAVAQKYDDLYQNNWSQLEDQQLQHWLGQLLRDSSISPRILDLGCGTGLAYRLLEEELASLSYVGLDISVRMLSQFADWTVQNTSARQIELLQGRAQDLRDLFEPNSFDIIWSTNTAASFCGSPTTLLKSCYYLLRDNGLVFLSFLNRTSLRRCIRAEWSALEVFDTRNSESQLGGVEAATVSAENLRKRCGRAGLQFSDVVYQSVLGGVAESALLSPIESLLSRRWASWGHSIAIIAKKQERHTSYAAALR